MDENRKNTIEVEMTEERGGFCRIPATFGECRRIGHIHKVLVNFSQISQNPLFKAGHICYNQVRIRGNDSPTLAPLPVTERLTIKSQAPKQNFREKF